MSHVFSFVDAIPSDWHEATLVGRLLTSDGPSVIVISRGVVIDVSRRYPTVADLMCAWPNAEIKGDVLGRLPQMEIGPAQGSLGLLAPLDLQCIKAAGVTFAASVLERVIEERARGDARAAAQIRGRITDRIGSELESVKPGSNQAQMLKQVLISEDLWSQYLEVAIGPDAEIFTKAPILSAVGWGQLIGVRSDSIWNNPEPEIVLVCDSNGRAVGAALGNDVNLRDFEGRSALLLGKAKDNNASCSIGPFVRMFDASFTLDDVRQSIVKLEIEGTDGFVLEGTSAMAQISRDPLELVEQLFSEHDYPDGAVLFLGTLFSPVKDRDVPGSGFTHKTGDRVRISSPKLGGLENIVVNCCDASPWKFGIRDLMRNLATRGLLTEPPR